VNRIVRKFINEAILQGKQAVVVGTGKSGLAAARLLDVLGAKVRVVDRDETVTAEKLGPLADKAELITGPHEKAHFADADMVVFSPGVPVRKLAPVLEDIPARNLVSELEFASWFIEAPILAVTGSNGKTTTTTLISEILEKSGRRVFTGGNIGVPLCEYLLDMEPAEIIVLEVSSFQLQNCHLFKPHVGVFLNFAANHLDYHKDLDEYLDAKLHLFSRMTGEDTALLHESLRPHLDGRGFTNAHIEWFASTSRFEAPHLLGEHNRSNVEAAWQAVKRFGISEEQAAEAIRDFRPLPHRIEPVAEKNGVLFVNDSKATTLDAAEAAVHAFDRPVRGRHQGPSGRRRAVRRLARHPGAGTEQTFYRDLGRDPGSGSTAAGVPGRAGRRDPALTGHIEFRPVPEHGRARRGLQTRGGGAPWLAR